MSNLSEYITAYSQRGACTCGRCADAVANPEKKQPAGHVADMIFFKVSAKEGASAGTLKTLLREHEGEFAQCNMLDDKEHSYIEVGAWIGDQGLALQLMGLGVLLGLWKLRTPRTMLGQETPEQMVKLMAGAGMVCVKREPDTNPDNVPRSGITKSRERILEEIAAGRKSRCIDDRDYMRLAMFFPLENLKTLGFELKEGVDASQKETVELNRENVLAQLEKDLAFAFEKALDRRGISADAMSEVVRMWMWVLDDELQDFTEYAQYGLPFLKAVALKFGFKNPIGEDEGNEDKYAS